MTIAAYEDFACPHCRDYCLNVLPEIESTYVEPGKIRYEHHDFPIPVAEPESYTAANAARAVQKHTNEGSRTFREYAGRLYENQSSLSPDLYASLANDRGLDGAAIREAAVNRAYKTTVMNDRDRERNKGVQATPMVFVDGAAVAEPTVEAGSSAIEQAT